MISSTLKNTIRALSNVHQSRNGKLIFVYATPRGGSTWFMEMLWSQPKFKSINEPLNVRNCKVQECLGFKQFSALYNAENEAKIIAYIKALNANKIKFLNPSPLRKNHRFFTENCVFKLIHYNLFDSQWLVKNFNAKVLIVLRHPIPVSLSREVFPLLSDFSDCKFREYFTSEQLSFIDKVAQSGTHLEKGMTAWCMHNGFITKDLDKKAYLVTYEQAVNEPEKIIQYLCESFNLPSEQVMLKQSYKASAVKNKSSKRNQALLKSKIGRKELINAWRLKVSEAEEKDLMGILDLFNMDVYQVGQNFARSSYLV
tara:strand:- start:348 stop:1286 length:939 start_codon:yes stop_codon:yes gene_type:complete